MVIQLGIDENADTCGSYLKGKVEVGDAHAVLAPVQHVAGVGEARVQLPLQGLLHAMVMQWSKVPSIKL
jgi:hypothetical protein